MNPANREAWGPSPNQGPPSNPQNIENASQQSSRPAGRFDGPPPPSQIPQQNSSGSGTTHVLPPPSGSYYSSNPSGTHSLPSISGLAQGPQSSPPQTTQRIPGQDPGLSAANHPGSQVPGAYSLPAINQAIPPPQHHNPQHPGIDRRLDGRDVRDVDRRGDDPAPSDMREREERERQHQERAAQESHAGPIQIHQPVAVAPQQRTVHGPNGLLGNPAAMAAVTAISNAPSVPIGGQGLFGGPGSQSVEGAARLQHAVQPPAQALLAPFAGPNGIGQQQLVGPQGQQPILNDALSYLDQVKVQFHEQPDVYNKFLDIMKDFKSGTIDTPGVIDRVSTLFAGHPNLIQGFNTFLPPGYKIECGLEGDPNSIRVTTPMGTTDTLLPSRRPLSAVNGAQSTSIDRHLYDGANRAPGSNWPPQSGTATSDVFAPGRQGQSLYNAQQAPGGQASLSPELRRVHLDGSVTALDVHQQEQQNVAQLQNAVTAAAGGALNRPNLLSPSGAAANVLPNQALNGVATAAHAGLVPGGEKRGPVEFNHAISYVNKIKNRFATQPDIYKQFLEILQTYQRESKPIQDVYAQVTTLFSAAPDLLEDFKQFLPESASNAKQAAQAHARQQAEENAPVSNLRGDANYVQQANVQGTPRPEQRLPPVGSFAPTPAKDSNKRKRGERPAPVSNSLAQPALEPAANARGNYTQPGSVNKRPKQHASTRQQTMPDGPVVDPTLIPALPEALPPTTSTTATQDELQFFDRARKFMGNKNTMNEFLKLCNLFSQDLISSEMLVHRAHAFIGGNPELMNFFKEWMGYEAADEVLEMRSQPSSGRVSLSNCRAYGPSYRLLPRRDIMRPCSGRDDLCRSVLNDTWASHPTWASEDSGFIAHRKNQHEEGLHRIEEERHDYDFNIEACQRTVQQLEPIAQQILQMTAEDRAAFKLPQGLGGQSESIYKRVIMKVYGREKGLQVLHNLFEFPYRVVPVILNRLKHKLEEWKAAQREWEKVWGEQTQKIFWKSLDHQSITAKQNDKRQFQTKTLQNEIQVKYEEQKRQREVQHLTPPRYQFKFDFEDVEVLQDAARLVLVYAEHNYHTDYPRLVNFIKEFVPLFYGIDVDQFEQRIRMSPYGTPDNDDGDDETPSPDDYTGRSQRGRKQNLLRGVLDRGRNPARGREDSNASGSRATTPEAGSAVDEDMAGTNDSSAGEVLDERPAEKWLNYKSAPTEQDIAYDQAYKREVFNMYCSLPIYCFFRMFVMLVERLTNLKLNEEEVRSQVRKAKAPKAAIDFKMIDKLPQDFFSDTSDSANYYRQVLTLFEDQAKGADVDMANIEETLRRYYLHVGWQLYSIDKLLNALTRFAIVILQGDGKDKTYDIYQLFRKDRQRAETTYKDEINYRKVVERYAKDSDVYRIRFDQSKMQADVRIVKKEDLTFDPNGYDNVEKWRYYISTYTSIEPTEGMEGQKIARPYDSRKLNAEDDESDDARVQHAKSEEDLVIRISVDGFKVFFEPKSEEFVVNSTQQQKQASTFLEEEQRAASEKTKEKMVISNTWMKNLSKDDVDQNKTSFEGLKGEIATDATRNTKNDDDVPMEDAS